MEETAAKLEYDAMIGEFEKIFGCHPLYFTGNEDPYYYQHYGAYGRELLEYFNICPECDGSGTAHAECCNGNRCQCQGRPVSYTCQRCVGTGKLNYKDNQGANSEFLIRWANSNGGYYFPKQH